jgi:hypothetical protein
MLLEVIVELGGCAAHHPAVCDSASHKCAKAVITVVPCRQHVKIEKHAIVPHMSGARISF